MNDSFAHVKRELTTLQQRNDMVDFMWSTFRKIAGINNKKPIEGENEKMKTNVTTIFNSTNQNSDAPLAKLDVDEL